MNVAMTVCKGWAGFAPNMNGQQPICLWDSGAQVSITDEATTASLVANGAKKKRLDRTMRLHGVGDGVLEATGMVTATLRLQDKVARKISLYIVPRCPYEVIVGYDFMMEQKLGFLPEADRVLILDGNKTGKPVIHDTSLDIARAGVNTGVVTTLGEEKAVMSELVKVDDIDLLLIQRARAEQKVKEMAGTERWNKASKNHKVLKTLRKTAMKDMQAESDSKWWKNQGKEEQEFLKLMNSVRLKAGVTEAQFRAAVEAVEMEADNEQGTDKKVFVAEPLNVPCDFENYQEKLNNLVNDFQDVFSAGGADVGRTKGDLVEIKVIPGSVVNERNYRTPLKLRAPLKVAIDELMKAGILERGESSQYNSPCLLVPKKVEGGKDAGHRLVVDYRKLNRVIENVTYPMPRIQDILSNYGGCQVFSVMDIRHAYYNIEIEPSSRALTAFSCELGKYQFKFLPQGLKISPAVFQDRIQRDLHDIERTTPFMDDIITGHSNCEDHMETLRRIFTRLRETGYKLKLSKAELMRKKVTFTGHDITPEGVVVNGCKREQIDKMVPPKTQSEAKSLLGFTSFLRSHINHYCDIVSPIQSLIRHGERGSADITKSWTARHQKAFETIKEKLLDGNILGYPDPEKPFELFTDASKYHMSGVLMQKDDNGKDRPIGYWSKAFKGSQLHWSALVKEARAVMEAVQHFKVFISGCMVILRCDHKPLQSFLFKQTKNDMVNRWSMSIQEYNMEFVWVSTDDNISDCLSRLVKDDIEALVRGDLYVRHEGVKPDEEFVKSSKAQGEGTDSRTVGTYFSTCTAWTSRCTYTLTADVSVVTPEKAKSITDLTVSEDKAIDNEQMHELQQQDVYCRRILENQLTATDKNGRFMVVDELLYRMVVGDQKGKEHLDCLALVIPKVLVLTVIVNMHLELLHSGRDRTLMALKKRVYWKTMAKDVTNYIRGCTDCIRRNLKTPSYPNLSIQPPKAPMDRLAVDLWSCKPGIAFTAICLLTNYPFLVVIPDKTSASATRALNQVLASIKTPREILSDNGGEFIGPEFTHILKQRNIKHVRCAPQSPRTNGILERFHGFLNQCIRLTMDLDDHSSWEDCAVAALEAYRKTPHTSSGETPLFLATGQEPVYDIDHLLPTIAKTVWQPDVGKMDLEKLKVATQLARKNTVLARLKHQGPVRKPAEEIKLGDMVYRENMGRSKIEPRWLSGYRVVEMISSRKAKIVDIKTKKTHIVGLRHLHLSNPLAEILRNTKVDCFPGRSKLYFRSDDYPDLGWSSPDEPMEIDEERTDKMKEITRNRDRDTGLQVPAEGREEPVLGTRSKRTRTRPSRFSDYIVGATERPSDGAVEGKSTK